MGAKLADLRRVCQLPVRDRNDVAGLIYGDFASLPITKLFVDLQISPNVASVGFFVAGLLGSALQMASGWWSFAGSLLLVLYYLLDCVDGEVARWRQVTDVRWSYFDYLFHMLVKPLCFCGVALGSWFELHRPWPFVAGFSAALATLWLKVFLAIPGMVFVQVLGARSGAPRAFAELPGSSQATPSGRSFELRFNATTLRAVMTNFDMGLVFLLVATLGDALGTEMSVPRLGNLGLRHLWLAYYGIILPLDFLDYLITYLRRGHFNAEMTRLITLAHAFDATPQAGRRQG
jgi:hypothetical protein